jgi:hypothetical protein
VSSFFYIELLDSIVSKRIPDHLKGRDKSRNAISETLNVDDLVAGLMPLNLIEPWRCDTGMRQGIRCESIRFEFYALFFILERYFVASSFSTTELRFKNRSFSRFGADNNAALEKLRMLRSFASTISMTILEVTNDHNE